MVILYVTARGVDERASDLLSIRMQDAFLRTYDMTNMLLKKQYERARDTDAGCYFRTHDTHKH